MLTWNTHSVGNPFDERRDIILNTVHASNPTFVALQETELKQSDQPWYPPGYSAFYSPAIPNQSGPRGVGLWIARVPGFIARRIPLKFPTSSFFVLCELTSHSLHQSWIIGSIYLNSNEADRNRSLPHLLDELRRIRHKFPLHTWLIGGDWNMNLQRVSTLTNTLGFLHVHPTNPNQQEHLFHSFHGRGGSTIDFIISSIDSPSPGILQNAPISDHYPVLFKTPPTHTINPQSVSPKLQSISKFINLPTQTTMMFLQNKTSTLMNSMSPSSIQHGTLHDNPTV